MPKLTQEPSYAKEGSNIVERDTTPIARFDRESLGRYLRGQGRGHTIRMGGGVIENTTMRGPGLPLLSRDSLP
jgi:hypothetical protein